MCYFKIGPLFAFFFLFRFQYGEDKEEIGNEKERMEEAKDQQEVNYINNAYEADIDNSDAEKQTQSTRL